MIVSFLETDWKLTRTIRLVVSSGIGASAGSAYGFFRWNTGRRIRDFPDVAPGRPVSIPWCANAHSASRVDVVDEDRPQVVASGFW